MRILHNKLNRDIAWSIGSFSILAVSGVAINFMIAWFRDMEALGVFNLTYAIYIVSSQISVLGIHYSVMRFSAFHEHNFNFRNEMINAAIFLSLLMGFTCFLTIFFGAHILGSIFHSKSAELAIKYSAFGLLFFPLNKVLLGYLNGLREMKFFSLLQSSRYLLVMICVMFISSSSLPFYYVTFGFFIAELITSISALIYINKQGLYVFGVKYINIFWVRTHLMFGGKGLLSGMFVELNSRVDVLLIGIYLPETQVGIYSFIAMLVDGAYHLLAMVRLNFNPIIVRSIRDNNPDALKGLFNKSLKYIYPITILLCIVIIISFWIISSFILPQKGLQGGLVPLVVLCTCLTAISGFIPFDNMLLSSGHPGYQTFQHLMVVSSNILLNLIFIPMYGIVGASIATGASYIIGIIAFTILIRICIKDMNFLIFKEKV